MKLPGLGAITGVDLRFEEPKTLVEVFEMLEVPKRTIICVSNPDVRFGTFSEVLKYIKEHPQKFAIVKNTGEEK